MKALYTIFLLVLSAQLNAQTYEWTKAMGASSTDNSYSMTLDNMGNLIIGGTYAYDSIDLDPSIATSYAPANGGDNIFFAKYDTDGNYIWSKSLTTPTNEQLFALTTDAIGNIYITGYFYDTMDFDPSSAVANLIITSPTPGIYLAKYDNNGNYLWAKAFDSIDSDQGFGIKTDHAGNIYLTGEFSETVDFDPSASVANLTAVNNWDAFLAKYDAFGNYIWAIGIGSNSDDFGRPILIDSAYNVYFSGFFSGTADFDPSASAATLSSSSGGNTFIAKYDASGNYIWAKNIGASRSYGFCFDQTGNICISGIFSGSGDFDPGPGTYTLTSNGLDDVFYGKYDVSGNLIWAKSFGGTSNDACFDLKLDNGGNIYLAGGFRNTVDFDPGSGINNAIATGTTYRNAYLARYNSTGNFQWVKTYGAAGEDQARNIAIHSSGDLYLTSWFNNTVDFNPDSPTDDHTSNGGQDFAITKYSNPTTTIENNLDTEKLSFKVYPNPTSGLLFCEVSESTILSIYNSTGALVLKKELNAGKHNLDISNFTSGAYLVRSNLNPKGIVITNQ